MDLELNDKPKWGSMDYWQKVEHLQKKYNFLLMQAKYAVNQCLPYNETVQEARNYQPFNEHRSKGILEWLIQWFNTSKQTT